MRDFMSSEITIESTKLSVRDAVIKVFDKFVAEADLDLDSLEEIRRKKKESELKEAQPLPESLSEIDPLTS